MKHLILLLSILSTQVATAEQYEIRAVNIGDGKISVQMRETTGDAPVSGDFLVDLVFGIKWNATYDVDLSNTINTTYEIRKSDVRKLKGGFHFQAFYANNLPLAIPDDWNADWIEIMNIQNSLDGGQVTGDFFICELGFDDTTEPDINVNLTGYYVPSLNGFAAGVALPVELINFTAQKSKNKSILHWITASEMNTTYFDIERSVDNKNWQLIATKQALGNGITSMDYTFVDENPMRANGFQKAIYYRLKMLDNDNAFDYSPVRSLQFENKTSFTFYPNPTQETLWLILDNKMDTSVKIYAANGKLLRTQKVSLGDTILEIDVSFLTNGTYFLSDGDGILHTFIKAAY